MGRFFALIGAGLGIVAGIVVLIFGSTIGWWIVGVCAPLVMLGVYDLFQTRHTLWRNYPIISHMRWLFEGIRPEIRQYLIESDADAFPFNREQRSLVYQRAKNDLQNMSTRNPCALASAGRPASTPIAARFSTFRR